MTLRPILKTFSLLISIVLLLNFCACSSSAPMDTSSASLNILCTGFSQYDWVKNIVGDNSGIEISTLLGKGVDIHNYQPTAEDIIKITNSDMIVLTGGESDNALLDIVKSSSNPNRIIFNMMNELGEDALLSANHSHPPDQHNHPDISEYDEHIWLSVKNAEILCKRLLEDIISLDPEGVDGYNKNANIYLELLRTLDTEYTRTIEASDNKDLVFADRYPFAYLARDYGLRCYAAFPGCSTETNANFDTILSLSGKIDELGLTAVLTIDGGISNIDESVISNAKSEGIKTLSLESLQSVTEAEIDSGLSYLSAMTDNLKIFKEALNRK